MLNFLKQQIVEPKAAWMSVNQTARLVLLRLDHLSQTITAHYPAKAIKKVPPPRLKSVNELKAEMEAYGLQKVGEPACTKVPKGPNERKAGSTRSKCDGCTCCELAIIKRYMPAEMAPVRLFTSTIVDIG